MHVLIVGAGMSGVGTGVIVAAAGHTVTLVDRRPTVGGLWSPGGHYPLARLQETADTYRFPGHPFPSSVRDLPTAAEVAEYVRSHAARGGLTEAHFRLSTDVRALRRVPPEEGGGWTATLVPFGVGDGGEEQLQADWVVVASGRESGPPTPMPAIKGLDSFRGRILTDRDTFAMGADELLAATGVARPLNSTKASAVPDAVGCTSNSGAAGGDPPPPFPNSVVIVGYGKTAMDLAMTLSDGGATVHVVASRRHWRMPSTFFGLIPSVPVMYTRAATVVMPSWAATTHAARALAGSLWPLAVAIQWLIVAIAYVSVLGRRDLTGPILTAALDWFRQSFCMIPDGFRRRLAARRIVVHAPDGVAAVAGPTSVRLTSGAVLSATAMLWCRGSEHRAGLSFLPPADVEALFAAGDGVRLYRHTVHPDVPRLAFVSAHNTFGFGTAVHRVATWVSEVWTGRLVLPPAAAQRAEVARVGAFKRDILSCNREPASVIMDRFYSFFDELCGDLSVEPVRVAGLAGWLQPLSPDWYAEVGVEARRASPGVTV